MKEIPLDREHFYAEPRIGDFVNIRVVPKFKVRRGLTIPFPKHRSLLWVVTSLDPLLGRPLSFTVTKTDYLGDVISVKTRRFSG